MSSHRYQPAHDSHCTASVGTQEGPYETKIPMEKEEMSTFLT